MRDPAPVTSATLPSKVSLVNAMVLSPAVLFDLVLTRRARRDRQASRAAVSILKADRRVGQALDRALADAGLTLPQFNVLMELASVDGAALPLYELTGRLISTPPNTSWLSSKMVEAGLVTKTRDLDDARVVVLALTECGWEALEAAAPLAFSAERELLAAYTQEDLRALADLLGRLVERPPVGK